MTKEELEKEAEEYALNTYEMCSYSNLPYASDRRAREQAFIAGAEPREAQIAHLEKSLIDVSEKLVKRNKELEKKIKKIRDYLAYKIPRELMNEATNKIWNMI